MSHGDILKPVNKLTSKIEKYRNLQEPLIIHKNNAKTLPEFKSSNPHGVYRTRDNSMKVSNPY